MAKLSAFVIVVLCTGTLFAQKVETKVSVPASLEDKFAAERSLADLAIAAHGGEKLKGLKSLVVRGSVEVTTSAIPQAIPATFLTIFAGEKYRFEIVNPFQPLKQVYDGTQTISSAQGGFTLPPINRLGFPLLQQLGRQGFVVTSIPDQKKKRKGFRMTSPEGYFTDFYLDEKTNQIRGYDSIYEMNGRTITTSVEIDKCRLVDGVLIPERYSQRFDIEQLTVYASFKAKDILVNSEVKDSIFSSVE